MDIPESILRSPSKSLSKLVQEKDIGLATVYRNRPSTLNELKTSITVYIRNISQADLQKVFANKTKQIQACIDAR
jgi:hypothetical protein